MWLVWILFAIPLSLAGLLLLYIGNKVMIKINKDNDEYKKWKEGR